MVPKYSVSSRTVFIYIKQKFQVIRLLQMRTRKHFFFCSRHDRGFEGKKEISEMSFSQQYMYCLVPDP